MLSPVYLVIDIFQALDKIYLTTHFEFSSFVDILTMTCSTCHHSFFMCWSLTWNKISCHFHCNNTNSNGFNGTSPLSSSVDIIMALQPLLMFARKPLNLILNRRHFRVSMNVLITLGYHNAVEYFILENLNDFDVLGPSPKMGAVVPYPFQDLLINKQFIVKWVHRVGPYRPIHFPDLIPICSRVFFTCTFHLNLTPRFMSKFALLAYGILRWLIISGM